MEHGKAIFDYADEEEQQPLLAQYHEGDQRLFLTFFDLRLRKPVTITTHAGAEHFLRDAANLVNEETWYTQRISFLEEQHQLGQLILSQMNDRLCAWGMLNGLSVSSSTSLELLDKVVEQATHQISVAKSLNANERSLHNDLMCFLALYQDQSGLEPAPQTLKRLITQTEDITALRELVKTQERNINGQRENVERLISESNGLSAEVARAQQLLADLNAALRDARFTELRLRIGELPEGREVGLPELLDHLKTYVSDRQLIAQGDIPF